MGEKEDITTPNLWLTGHIIYVTQCKSSFEHNGAMLLFSLPKTEAVMKAMADFNNGGLVPAIEYAEIIKRLRHEMYVAKTERESASGTGEKDGFYRKAF
jgi:hypothetical protein